MTRDIILTGIIASIPCGLISLPLFYKTSPLKQRIILVLIKFLLFFAAIAIGFSPFGKSLAFGIGAFFGMILGLCTLAGACTLIFIGMWTTGRPEKDFQGHLTGNPERISFEKAILYAILGFVVLAFTGALYEHPHSMARGIIDSHHHDD